MQMVNDGKPTVHWCPHCGTLKTEGGVPASKAPDLAVGKLLPSRANAIDQDKEYLGDGCYCAFDGFSLVLTTEDGILVQNEIILEAEVYNALVEYAEKHLRHGRGGPTTLLGSP